MIKFTEKEKKFLASMEEARFATANKTIPHVKPVSFIFQNSSFYIATDYSTITYKNIKKNPRAAVSVDIYKPGGHKAILVQGDTKIIENGSEFKKIYAKFFEKFAWVRKDPWDENEAPFLRLVPKHKTSWGLA